MTLNTQESLGYKFPEMLTTKTDVEIPLNARQVEQWLSGLSMLNIDKLSSQIPLYLYKFNRRLISDKERFLILECLRPVVSHLDDCLIKQIKGGNLKLSKQYRDVQSITKELYAGMAIGYQRLLWNKLKNKPNFFNRGKYGLLAERAIFYLGEKIRISYVLNSAVPENTWKELYSSYAFTVAYQLNERKIKDQFAFNQGKKDSIDNIFHRVLLLAMVSPYSLRSGELDQIYFSLEQWLNGVKLKAEVKEHSNGYFLDFDRDLGPIYVDDISPTEKMYEVDSSELVIKLKKWLESDIAPESSARKGMSSKLLKQTITNLEMTMRRSNDRLKSRGEPVEIVIGFQNINEYLSQLKPLIKKETILAEKTELSLKQNVKDKGRNWHAPSSKAKDIHELQYYQPEIDQKKKTVKTEIKETPQPTVRLHIFNVENESASGVCLSCDNLQGDGLFIGELLLIRGFEFEIWTLGVVRWMKYADNRLSTGVYLLSSNIAHITVEKQGIYGGGQVDALWLAEGEHGKTILLSSGEFKTGDYLELNHPTERLFITLGEAIWYSGEGFVQYKFKVESSEQLSPPKKADYLMAD